MLRICLAIAFILFVTPAALAGECPTGLKHAEEAVRVEYAASDGSVVIHAGMRSGCQSLKGSWQGRVMGKFESGARDIGHYSEGKIHGRYQFWLPTNQVVEDKTYKNGELHGRVRTWHANGEMRQDGNFLDGKMNGKFTEWYSTGQVKASKSYEAGLKHGQWRSWHSNGHKEGEVFFTKGMLEGKVLSWYPDGSKKGDLSYKNGKLHGKARGWYPNGQMEGLGYFQNDKQHGTFTHWSQSGEKVSETDYTLGKIVKENVVSPKSEASDKEVKPREDPDAILIHAIMKPIYDLNLSLCEDLTTLQEAQRKRRIAKAFKKMKRRWKGKRISLSDCLVMDEQPAYRTIGKGIFPKRKRLKGVSDIQAILPQFQNGYYCNEDESEEPWYEADSEWTERTLQVEVSVTKRSRIRSGKTAIKCSTQTLAGRIHDLELEAHCYSDRPSLKIHLR